MPPSFPGWPGPSSREKAVTDTLPAESNGTALMLNHHSSSASSGHYFETINASGHASLHLGDVHYHATPPSTSAKEQLMASLHFPEIFKRSESIQDPHNNTFNWVLKPPRKEQQWSSFVGWLRQTGGLYWISGKPGSGKSVLTKYLTQYAQRNRGLEAQSPIVLSFWFWEAAHTPLERNLFGCLRSLLWQLLNHPHHGDGICKAISSNLTFEWTLKRLQDALNNVLKLLACLHIPVLIFLDGLDECGGSGREVLNFATSIVKQHDNLKLCISSRPEPLYQVTLSSYPHLRMQDLNEPDVYAIIDQDLLQTSEFDLLAANERQSKDLQRQIAYMAQGVLLWVRLVTRDLVQGIVDGDTIMQLQRHLVKMPSELDGDNGLYAFMLKRNAANSESYLADAAFYLRLASHREMSVIEFRLASDEKLRARYTQLAGGWENLHFELDCDRMARAVSARTAGLLEVVRRPPNLYKRAAKNRCAVLTNILNAYEESGISFIHRTAWTYIFETSAGHQIMAASTKSVNDIKHICFETWLISWIVLGALESVAPVGLWAASGGWLDCESCADSTPTPDIYLLQTKHIFRQLEQKGFLWTVPHQTLYWTLCGTYLPIPKLNAQQLNFGSLFASQRIWEFTKSEWDTGVLDPSNTFNLFRSVVVGLEVENLRTKLSQTPIMRKGLELCYEMLSDCPDPNAEVTDTDGERLPAFYSVVFISERLPLQVRRGKPIGFWLEQASADTLTRKCKPTMGRCNQQFFLPRHRITILGAFSYADVTPLLDPAEDENGPDQLSVKPDTVDTGCIIWEWPSGAWKPAMYKLSPLDGTVPLRKLIRWTNAQRWEYDVGMITLDHDDDELFHLSQIYLSHIIPASLTQVTELRSLVEVFQALGKTAEAITTFAAAEDDRIRLAYDEVIYRHWRSWMYGIDDPLLQQYWRMPRPYTLPYSLNAEVDKGESLDDEETDDES